jgi:hypothetical protein
MLKALLAPALAEGTILSFASLWKRTGAGNRWDGEWDVDETRASLCAFSRAIAKEQRARGRRSIYFAMPSYPYGRDPPRDVLRRPDLATFLRTVKGMFEVRVLALARDPLELDLQRFDADAARAARMYEDSLTYLSSELEHVVSQHTSCALEGRSSDDLDQSAAKCACYRVMNYTRVSEQPGEYLESVAEFFGGIDVALLDPTGVRPTRMDHTGTFGPLERQRFDAVHSSKWSTLLKPANSCLLAQSRRAARVAEDGY